jgi:DNA-binding MarR family transcriptional regulator
MNDRNRFILKPRFGNLAEYQLHYKDILTYVTIRSYYNTQKKYAYPSYATIKSRSGLSVKFISESVKRLEAAGFIDIWKVGKFHVSHYYRFDETMGRQMIPYDLLDSEDLTTTEKCMLLMIADSGSTSFDYEQAIDTISKNSGLVKKTITHHVKTLILKDYLAEELFENPLDKSLTKYLKLTDKFKWKLNYTSSAASLKANESQPKSEIEDIIKMATDVFRPKKIAIR